MQLFPSFHLQQRMLERGLCADEIVEAVRCGKVYIQERGSVGIFKHRGIKVVVNLHSGKVITAYRRSCVTKKMLKQARRNRKDRGRYAT